MAEQKRYADLPATTRAFFETLTESECMALFDAARVIRTIPSASLDCFVNARPETMMWLRDARPEDIKQLEEGLLLVTSSRTVGRFLKWGFISLVGGLVVVGQFGDAINKVFSWFKK